MSQDDLPQPPETAAAREGLAKVVALISATAERGEPPVVLQTSPWDVERVRKILLEAGAAESAFRVEAEPPPTPPQLPLITSTTATLSFAMPWRMSEISRGLYARANELLGANRPDDPETAAAMRADRARRKAEQFAKRQPKARR